MSVTIGRAESTEGDPINQEMINVPALEGDNQMDLDATTPGEVVNQDI